MFGVTSVVMVILLARSGNAQGTGWQQQLKNVNCGRPKKNGEKNEKCGLVIEGEEEVSKEEHLERGRAQEGKAQEGRAQEGRAQEGRAQEGRAHERKAQEER